MAPQVDVSPAWDSQKSPMEVPPQELWRVSPGPLLALFDVPASARL